MRALCPFCRAMVVADRQVLPYLCPNCRRPALQLQWARRRVTLSLVNVAKVAFPVGAMFLAVLALLDMIGLPSFSFGISVLLLLGAIADVFDAAAGFETEIHTENGGMLDTSERSISNRKLIYGLVQFLAGGFGFLIWANVVT